MWDFDTIGVSPRRVTGNTGGNWYFLKNFYDAISQRSGEMQLTKTYFGVSLL